MKEILHLEEFYFYTLRFTAKTYLFGPVTSASKDIIKTASVRYLAGGSQSTQRDVTFSVKPRALKDYTDDVVTTISEDIDASQKTINVADGTKITVNKYIDVDGEEMKVTKITGINLPFQEVKIVRLLRHMLEELESRVLIIPQEKIVISLNWVMTLDLTGLTHVKPTD